MNVSYNVFDWSYSVTCTLKKKTENLIVDLRPPFMQKALVWMPCFHFSINRGWFQDRRSPLASGMLLWSWPCNLFSLWSGPRQKWMALMGIYKPFINTLFLTSVHLFYICLTFAFISFLFFCPLRLSICSILLQRSGPTNFTAHIQLF